MTDKIVKKISMVFTICTELNLHSLACYAVKLSPFLTKSISQ